MLRFKIPRITFNRYFRNEDFNCRRLFTTNSTAVRRELVAPKFTKQCGWWLIGCSGLVGGMTMLGGYTRLKRAGLSMTEWSFAGKGYPFDESEWNVQFEKYKETPEYKKVHYGMSLAEFKNIYFIEWFHRMTGRGVGLVFASGMAYFIARRALSAGMIARLGGFLCLGGCQGLIGWWMVKSGLVDKDMPRVSAIRLVTHLGLAVGLYAGLLWNGLNLVRPNSRDLVQVLDNPTVIRSVSRLNFVGKLLFVLTFATLMSGGLVAGLDAGRAYNTWPKMNDSWTPTELKNLSWLNWTEKFIGDTGIAQFNHRNMAYLTFLSNSSLFHVAAHYMSAMTGIQLCLGIGTLLMTVPPYMGVLHQAGGMLALSAVIFFLHCSRVPPSVIKSAAAALK